MLSVKFFIVMLSVILLGKIRLSVILLNVVAPLCLITKVVMVFCWAFVVKTHPTLRKIARMLRLFCEKAFSRSKICLC
jgi:hypothetical protein